MSVQVSLVGCDTIAPSTVPVNIIVNGDAGSTTLGSTDTLTFDGSCGVKSTVSKVGADVTVGLTIPSSVSRATAGWAESWDQLPVCRTDGGIGLPPAKGSVVGSSYTATQTTFTANGGVGRPESTVVQNIYFGNMASKVFLGGFLSVNLNNGSNSLNGYSVSILSANRNGVSISGLIVQAYERVMSLSSNTTAGMVTANDVMGHSVLPTLSSGQVSTLTVFHSADLSFPGEAVAYYARVTEELVSV